MDQQPIEESHSGDETDNKPQRNPIQWRHVFDWGFWTGHPLSTIAAFFIGGILLSAITNFPGGSPKQLWFVAAGLWVLIGVIIYWMFGGIIAHLEGRELLTNEEIEQREQEFKQGIQSRLNKLETGISDTQRQIEEQRPRHLTEEQKLAIKATIAPFHGQKIVVKCLTWDAETSRYAQDFVSVFTEAGWDCGPVENVNFPMSFYNAQVFVNDQTKKVEDAPRGAMPLHNILIHLGISKDTGQIPFTQDTKEGELTFRVGARPPTAIKPPSK